MRDLVRVTGTIVILALLFTIVVGASQARQAKSEGNPAAPAENTQLTEDMILVCLILVSGTALLAGAVWMGKLRAWTR